MECTISSGCLPELVWKFFPAVPSTGAHREGLVTRVAVLSLGRPPAHMGQLIREAGRVGVCLASLPKQYLHSPVLPAPVLPSLGA